MILASINWNVDPEIFRIGSIAVRWYGLMFASAFFFGYLIFTKFFKNEDIKIELLDQLLIYVAIGTVLGARLGHCLFYQPEYYLNNPLEIFMVWKGGLASHGAAIGIPIALYLFARKNNKRYFWLIDRVVIAVALGGMFIRLGNLMNSEIYGIETSLPWGFVFLRDGQTIPKHPTQIYEALSYLAIFVLLYVWYWRKKGVLKDGVVFSVFLILLFTVRFFIEFVKEVQVPFEQGMQLNMGQILSIPFIMAGIGLLVYFLKRPKAESKSKPK